MAHEVYTIAVLSTAHVTAAEAEELDSPEFYPQIPFTFAPVPEVGWFFSTHGALTNPSAALRWPNLQRVRQWAARQGYGYVLMDRDAERVPELPEYDW